MTNQQDDKAREFWIEFGSFTKAVHDSKEKLFGWTISEPVHVIEKRAYDALEARLKIAVDALKLIESTPPITPTEKAVQRHAWGALTKIREGKG